MKKIAGCIIMLVLLSFPAFAWQITEELKQETAQKLAQVQAQPDSAQAHFELAMTYAYTNKIQEGWSELKKVNDMDKTFAGRALKIYTEKVKNDPLNWKEKYRLAFALYFNNKKEEAIQEFKEILALDPKNVFAYGYIGLILGEMGQVDQAITTIKEGLSKDSNVAALHLLLAEAYNRKGRGWDAFAEGVEALRLKALGN